MRFVEIDPRVGGAYRVVIEPGGVLANGGGDVVEVTGELFGKFSRSGAILRLWEFDSPDRTG